MLDIAHPGRVAFPACDPRPYTHPMYLIGL
nr:MAG TPA: hypothetical protein [Caudoviricetes sp.]